MVDTKPDSSLDPNLATYNSPAVAEYYATLNYLTPCERLLFDEQLRPGMAILDLGVGGGRTTPDLSSIAGRYVGVDYAPEMIAGCQKKFPHLEFVEGSAVDLSRFASSSFDAVVMAFNAIDYIFPQPSRFRAIQEIYRVLKPGGILIFSSHNPRSIFVRVSWNPKRIQVIAESIASTNSFLFRSVLWPLTVARAIIAVFQAALRSLARSARRLLTTAFWHGEGYWTDPAHGGLKTHLAVPEKVVNEVGRLGFLLRRVLGDDYPRVSNRYVTDWYYYVFSKSEVTGEE